MTFAEVLEQIIDLLRNQGHVSYRTLQTTFDLDDAYLEELQAVLIHTHQLAADEGGEALVWTGSPAAGASHAAIPAIPRGLEAERRQMTVMRGRLIGGTSQTGRLEPGVLCELLHTYRSACQDVIERVGGYLASPPGDDLLAYFGYPQAREDDVPRAVRAGLDIVASVARLNAQMQPRWDFQMAVCIALHTDLAVVSLRSGPDRPEPAVVGDTLHTVSWLLEHGGQNMVVISPAVHRLVQGFFVCQDLGPHWFKNASTPVHAYGVLRESGARSRLEALAPGGLTPLVGRQQEVALLHERWHQARQGTGQVVLLSGEAGIGKSRLVHVLKTSVLDEPHVWWECRGSPQHRHSAFYPVIDVLERTLQFAKGDTPADRLRKLEDAFTGAGLDLHETVPWVAALLSLPLPRDRYPSLTLATQRQRHKTIETLLSILAACAARQPTLLIVEDLQWLDASTLELLEHLITQGVPPGLMVVLTYRPDVDHTWPGTPQVTRIVLQHLGLREIGEMAVQVAGGKALPDELVQHLIAKTDGIPLFVEELTKMALTSDLLWEHDDRYDLMSSVPTLAIPTTLQGSLMARIDQSAAGKAVAQLGATIGRRFSYELIRDASPFNETALQKGLQQLVAAELLYQRGAPPHATYVFKHALIQDVAYQSLIRSTRQDYHGRIARVLEARFPEIAAAQPELLAHHLTEAGLGTSALPYWLAAAKQAIKRSAHIETIGHLTQGIALVRTLTDTPARTQHDLTLHLILGNTLVKLKGYGTPEVGQAYAQARTLCQQLRDPHQMARVLYGLWVFYLTRAEFQTAHELAQQLFDLAQTQRDPDSLLRGHNALGTTLCFLGEFAQAHAHLAHDAARHPSPAASRRRSMEAVVPQVANLAYASWALWYMGYPDQALATSQAAQELAHARAHSFCQAIAAFYSAILHQLRREPDAARERAEATITLATEMEFPVWVAGGLLVRGWALTAQGHLEAGLEQIQEGLAAWRTTGADLIRPSGLAKLAEAYAANDKPDLGLKVLTEALDAVQQTGMRYYEAELYRLQGQLRLQADGGRHSEAAEASFHKALDVAHQQQARSLALRAAVSLGRLWQQQGKRQAAARLLTPLYGWFHEGFDTADLLDAKALLKTLMD